MPNKSIGTATDISSLVKTDLIPVERPGNATPYRASFAEISQFVKPGIYNPLEYGSLGRSAIQQAVDDAYAAMGGYVFVPPPKPWARISLDGPIVVKRGVSIGGIYPGSGTTSTPASWEPEDINTGTVFTCPGGTAFTQDLSGGIGVLASLDGVIYENMGFDDVDCMFRCGATNKSGLDGGIIYNFLGSRVTGIALDLANILNSNISNIQATCAQLLRISSDYDTSVPGMGHQPGNTEIHALYAQILAAGENLPAVHLRTLNGVNGTFLNFLVFTGLQVNRFYVNAGTGKHLFLEGNSTATINGCKFYDLDLEGSAQYTIDASYITKTKFDFVEDHGQAVGCLAGIRLRNSDLTTIEADTYAITLDQDATATNTYVLGGKLADVVGAGGLPLGLYGIHDVGSLNAGLHLGSGAIPPNPTFTGLQDGDLYTSDRQLMMFRGAVSYEVPAYANWGGTGDRQSSIGVFTDLGWSVDDVHMSALVSGVLDNSENVYLANGVDVTGHYLRFDFGTKRRITEMRIIFSAGAMNCGTWRFRVSQDSVNWFIVGSPFVLTTAGGATLFTELAGNGAGYRYYEIQGVSGNTSWDQTWNEVEFKIGNMA